MSTRNWVPFHWDNNHAWGLIDSPEEWERIKRVNLEHGRTLAELLDAGNNPNAKEPSFGFRREHRDGDTTLRAFFETHGMTP